VPGHDVQWCFHTTAMVADYERTRDALAWLVGMRVLEDEREEDPAIGRRGGMAWIGDSAIELGEPIVAGGAVDRFVRRFGSHMSSIAVQVADTDATTAFLEAHACRVASRVGDVVFTDPRATAGVVVEWFGGAPPNDPRWGTPIPPYRCDPLLDVTQLAFAGAVVDDPRQAAERLAELFGTRVTYAVADGAGVSLVDMTLALFPLPRDAAESERLWGHTYDRPQTSSLGVRVPDVGGALDALTGAGVALVRHDDRMIVVHPDATGGVIVCVVDELLPGDPRGV
jgi:catechol 2,3-dioxygenase-like lactoylglutathione lyase family enzyme